MKSSCTQISSKYLSSLKLDNGVVVNNCSVDVIKELQTELVHYKEENKRLIGQNNQLESTVAKFKSTSQTFKEENDRLKRKVRELQRRLTAPTNNAADSDSACSVRCTNAGATLISSSSASSSPSSSPSHLRRVATPVVPKIAEKIRLKRLPFGEVHGSEISAFGVLNTKLAEHLVEDIEDASELNELLRSSYSSLRKKEFKLELEKLRSKADHLKSQVGVLEVTLNESRTNCENLSIVCAQLESNQTALRMVLSYADRTQEIVECLLMLAETQLSLTLATCQASEIVSKGDLSSSDKMEINNMLLTARQQRNTAEAIASQLCKRLRNNSADSNSSPNGHLSSSSASLFLDELTDGTFTIDQEDALREYCGRLKSHKDSVHATVLPVSSALCESLEQNLLSTEQTSSSSCSLQEQKLNLENAVLLQELSALKEDRADLRAQIYLLEKENERCRLTVEGKETEYNACRMQIDHLTQEINLLSSNRDEIGCGNLLNKKINDVTSVLDSLVTNSDLRARKSDELINDLKRANVALLSGFERSKRKYHNKIYRLYEQLALSSEKYQLQIKGLKSRISSIELESGDLSHCIHGYETNF